MTQYRERLYKAYYSTHSGVADVQAQKALFEQQKRYFEREIIPHLPSLSNLEILDIGCGTGSLLSAMQTAGYSKTMGIDLSPEQLEKARQFGVSNVHSAEAIQFLESRIDHFDVITAIDILEHLNKDEAVKLLLVIKNSLRKDGVLIMRVPNMDAPMTSIFAYADYTHELFLNKASASQLLHSLQFADVEVLPGLIFIENPLKELLRKVLWWKTKIILKLMLFSTGRTWHEVYFTPNLLIKAKKGI
jgi:2-polyprenyl-3-methyl-5-hydroxy-6-metoxy-1,4-benzoquinol methylase